MQTKIQSETKISLVYLKSGLLENAPKQTSLVLIQKIPGNLRNIFGGQGVGGLPGPIPSTEVRTPKASFNRGTIKIPPISKCPNICTIYAKMQIMQQINANKNTIRDQNIVSVPKIGSPGKCTKANKLSFNTENPGEPEEHFRRTGGGRPTWTNSFYRSKNP